MKKAKVIFRSRISILMIIFTLVILIPVFINIFQYGNYQELFIIVVALSPFPLILTGMRYEISDGKLIMKICSIPCSSIDIAYIISVKRSYNPLASNAASLKRLRLDLSKGANFLLISPVREQEFIKELKAVNENISINIPERRGAWRIWDWDI